MTVAVGDCSLRAVIDEANAYSAMPVSVFIADGTHSLTVAGSDDNNTAGGLDVDPTPTRLPGAASPAREAIPVGTSGLCDGSVTTDQRGAARPRRPRATWARRARAVPGGRVRLTSHVDPLPHPTRP